MNHYKCYFGRLVYVFHAETEEEAKEIARVRWGIQPSQAHRITAVPVNEDGTRIVTSQSV